MQAYFSKGLDLSNQEELLHLASLCLLPVDEAKAILNSNSFEAEVHADIQQANRIGIRGVPYFLINGKKSISGAQDDKVFERALMDAIQ